MVDDSKIPYHNCVRAKITVDHVVEFNKEEHYSFVADWWSFYYEGDTIPKECLPDSGAVIIYKGKPVAIAFLYKTNAKIAQMHFTIADPAMGAGRRVFFIRKAVAACIEMAKEWLDGKGFIWTCTDNAVVGRVYTENGMECPGEADVYFLGAGDSDPEFLK